MQKRAGYSPYYASSYWGGEGEIYTPRTPKNLLPGEAGRMNFAAKKMTSPRNLGRNILNIVGHWPIGSEMRERYDHSVGPDEIMLRNSSLAKIASGWEMGPAYHFPHNVNQNERIGKTPFETATKPMWKCISSQRKCQI